jgi:hypothetical protein
MEHITDQDERSEQDQTCAKNQLIAVLHVPNLLIGLDVKPEFPR